MDGYEFRAAPGDGQTVTLGVRPEHVGVGGDGRWPGFTVEILERMGADNLAWCGDTGVSLAVRLPAEQAPRPGDRLALDIDPRRVSLFATDSGLRI